MTERHDGGPAGRDHFLRGEQAQEQGDFEGAIKSFIAAVDAGYTDALFDVGCVYNDELHDLEQAVVWWRKAAKLGDTQAANRIVLEAQVRAQQAGADGDREEAIKWYTFAVGEGAKGAMLNLSGLAKASGDVDLAREWALRAGESGNSYGYFMVAAIDEERGNLDDAFRYYRMSAESPSRESRNEGIQKAGEVAERQGDIAKAAACYADTARSGYYPSMIRRAHCLEEQGDDLEALAQFDSADREYAAGSYFYDPRKYSHLAAMQTYVRILDRCGQFESKAAEWFDDAGRGTPRAAFMYGIVCQYRGKPRQAIEWFSRAADRQYPAAFHALREINDVEEQVQ